MASITTINLLERIAEHYPSLSPSAQTIANYLQKNPLAVITQSTALLAENTNTSKATVSRFFRQLGFASHQEAKLALDTLREEGVPLARSPADAPMLDSELNNINSTFSNIDENQLKAIAAEFISSRQVHIIGFRNGFPLALHLRQQLKQIRANVHLLPQPGQTLSEDIIDISPEDLVVLFGFRRRIQRFNVLLDQLSQKQVVLITDPTGQQYRDKVNHLLVCHVGNDAPFDSYAAPMSLISCLCNLSYSQLGDKAVERVETIRDSYNHMNELAPSAQ